MKIIVTKIKEFLIAEAFSDNKEKLFRDLDTFIEYVNENPLTVDDIIMLQDSLEFDTSKTLKNLTEVITHPLLDIQGMVKLVSSKANTDLLNKLKFYTERNSEKVTIVELDTSELQVDVKDALKFLKGEIVTDKKAKKARLIIERQLKEDLTVDEIDKTEVITSEKKLKSLDINLENYEHNNTINKFVQPVVREVQLITTDYLKAMAILPDILKMDNWFILEPDRQYKTGAFVASNTEGFNVMDIKEVYENKLKNASNYTDKYVCISFPEDDGNDYSDNIVIGNTIKNICSDRNILYISSPKSYFKIEGLDTYILVSNYMDLIKITSSVGIKNMNWIYYPGDYSIPEEDTWGLIKSAFPNINNNLLKRGVQY